MDAINWRQLPDITNNVQDKLSRDLIKKSQELLNRLKRSIKKSNEFNEKALKYLNNSARESIADNINFVPEEVPEMKR